MSREEAIYRLKALLTMCDFRDAYGNTVSHTVYDEAVDMAIEALKAQQWIPCEERLPEMGQKVWASGVQSVFSHVYKGYEEDVHRWVWRDYPKTITAWQPIPKPYKMNDLISRQQVLALAKDVVLQNGAKHKCIDATQIWELPSVEPEQRWIPCSERLPDTEGRYLITRTIDEESTVVTAIWIDDGWIGKFAKNVVAWMPLPETYKGERR